jgi:hypothetical protein
MGKRKQHENDKKLSIARSALLPGSNNTSGARSKGLNESTVWGWVKSVAKLEEDILAENHNDSLNLRKRIRLDFCHQARSLKPPVLLTVEIILDNCGPHGSNVSDPNGQVITVPLSPNCTAVHQPMDQCIIQAFKKGY